MPITGEQLRAALDAELEDRGMGRDRFVVAQSRSARRPRVRTGRESHEEGRAHLALHALLERVATRLNSG